MKPEPTPRGCGSLVAGLLRLPRGAAFGLVRHRDAEAAEELLHVLVDLRRRRRAPRARPLGGADVDHRRADLLDQLGEVGQPCALRRHAARPAQRQAERERDERASAGRAGGERASADAIAFKTPSSRGSIARSHRKCAACGRAAASTASCARAPSANSLQGRRRHVADHGDPPVALALHQRLRRADAEASIGRGVALRRRTAR